MSHDYHEGHPGYSAAQVLCDGCGECEWRGQHAGRGIGNLDMDSFARAWQRATAFGKGRLADASAAEAPLLDALWAVQVQFERLGVPLGELPSGLPWLTAPEPAQVTA